MKKSRFSEEQIAYALRLADSGTAVLDVCRQIGISEATFYTWKKKYGELGVSELRKLRMLEDENARRRPERARGTQDATGVWGGQKPAAIGRQLERGVGLHALR